jgi:hypothetical protein
MRDLGAIEVHGISRWVFEEVLCGSLLTATSAGALALLHRSGAARLAALQAPNLRAIGFGHRHASNLMADR